MNLDKAVTLVVEKNPDVGEVLFNMLEEQKNLASIYNIPEEEMPATARFIEVLADVFAAVQESQDNG